MLRTPSLRTYARDQPCAREHAAGEAIALTKPCTRARLRGPPPLLARCVYGEQALSVMLKEADADGSGALDKVEVRSLLRGLGFDDISDAFIDGSWAIFDINGDGVLDLDEVRDMVRHLLAAASSLARAENYSASG